ncbi:MAG: PhnD/SsuA/transferrin family substrate-binding protein [Desulfuromonadales bacterium]
MKRILSKFFFLFFLLSATIASHASASDVRIGVLSVRGPEDAKYWQQVADELNARIPAYHFVIVLHTYVSLNQAVSGNQLEFVVANPSQYVELEANYSAYRIATLVSHVGQTDTSFFGTVIFSKASRTDIATLNDIKGRSLITASKTAFASWVVTRDELKKQGISPEALAAVRFAGSSADSVVMAVKNGEADAGAVRTGVLEQLAQEGKIALTDFRILNRKHVEGFPFLLSSELYPEFAFARLKQTDRKLTNMVAAQLLLIPHNVPSNRYPNPIGWTVPENYRKVRELMQRWKMPPYQEYGRVSLLEAVRQNKITVSLTLTAFVSLVLVIVLSLNIRQKRTKYKILSEAKQKLDLIRTMVEATPDAVFIKDRRGCYVFVNSGATRIIGRPSEEIIGKDISDFYPPEVAKVKVDTDNKVMSDACTVNYEEQSMVHDETRDLLVTKGPMYDDQGRVDGIFVVARDITEIKQLQREVADKVVRLETALEKVHQLEGIIPICSYCKKIRDDKESWHQMEYYIMNHSEAKFSHGICPDCYAIQMLEINAMQV